jgi:hypothetical protein
MVFRKPARFNSSWLAAMSLAGDFVANFLTYLTSHYAAVTPGNRVFEGRGTLRFQGIVPMGSLNLAAPHHDWVLPQYSDDTRGFAAQTLKRLFFEPVQDATVAAGAGAAGSLIPGLGPIVGPVVAADAVAVNKKHFLALRRC